MAKTPIDYIEALGPEDLVTSKEETRAGFIAMALEKNAASIPHIAKAKVLRAQASQAQTARDLINIEGIRAGLITASGLSEKAAGHLSQADLNQALLDLIEKILEPTGAEFVDELVYRYLLIKGDSMGGEMRNLAGRLGHRKFLRTIIATLAVAGNGFWWKDSKSNRWHQGEPQIEGIEDTTRALFWKIGAKDRLLLTNVNFPIVRRSNVDFALFDAGMADYGRGRSELVKQYTRALILGELKAGIDPAGADSHWKEAHTALNRIRGAFAKQGAYPKIAFIAAAITSRMGSEIVEQIDSGILGYAANLTKDEQVAMACAWITSA
jgi:hypothetical protein